MCRLVQISGVLVRQLLDLQSISRHNLKNSSLCIMKGITVCCYCMIACFTRRISALLTHCHTFAGECWLIFLKLIHVNMIELCKNNNVWYRVFYSEKYLKDLILLFQY